VIKLDDSNCEFDSSKYGSRYFRYVTLFKLLKLSFRKQNSGAYINWRAEAKNALIHHSGEFRKHAVRKTIEQHLNYYPSNLQQALIMLAFEKL
jgi:hypothetical protein